jgi:hypothetical protein
LRKTTKAADGQSLTTKADLAQKAGLFELTSKKALEWRHHIPETVEGQSFC